MKQQIAGLTLLLGGMSLVGCSNTQNPPPATPPPAAPAPVVVNNSTPAPTSTTTTVMTPGGPNATKVNTNAGPGTSQGTNPQLAQTIQTAILQNKQMTGSRVEVVADGTVATLTGTVQNQQQKALAQKAATDNGASAVKNKLEIVATGGAKPKPKVVVKTKTQTKVIDHYVPVPVKDNSQGDKSGKDSSAAPAGDATTGGDAATSAPAPTAPSGTNP